VFCWSGVMASLMGFSKTLGFLEDPGLPAFSGAMGGTLNPRNHFFNDNII
jgi:hypothetical protein